MVRMTYMKLSSPLIRTLSGPYIMLIQSTRAPNLLFRKQSVQLRKQVEEVHCKAEELWQASNHRIVPLGALSRTGWDSFEKELLLGSQVFGSYFLPFEQVEKDVAAPPLPGIAHEEGFTFPPEHFAADRAEYCAPCSGGPSRLIMYILYSYPKVRMW